MLVINPWVAIPIALNSYDQSLGLMQSLGDHAGEARIFSNIGYLLDDQGKTELAIVFFKASVNKYETIREDLQNLPEDLQGQQQTYTDSIDGNYRKLADLLLQQGRILEAQQVLDLLKVQELDEYLRGVRGPEDTLTIPPPRTRNPPALQPPSRKCHHHQSRTCHPPQTPLRRRHPSHPRRTAIR